MTEIKGLSLEHIKALLAAPEKKPRGKKGPDPNIRTIENWFQFSAITRDEAMGEDLRCDNPNCLDPRPPRISPLDGSEIKHQFVIVVKGQLCCRHCFLGGWLLDNPAQGSLDG